MKNLIIIIILISSLTNCKKILSVSEPEHYISGHLYNDCNGIPIKNRGLYMYREAEIRGDETTKGTCTTDSTGYFKLDYKALSNGIPLEIRFANSNYAIVYLTGNPIVNIDNAKLYGISTCNITVKLNVTNPKTSGDTLYVTDFRNSSSLKIPGPFVSGTVYTANNFNLLTPNYPINKIRFAYLFNGDNNTAIEKYFEVKTCQTNTVIADIN